MSRVQDEPSKDAPALCLAEHELAASSPSLSAQPALWPALRLDGGGAAHEWPWTTCWLTRLDATPLIEQARCRCEAAFAARDDRAGELLCIAAISWWCRPAPLRAGLRPAGRSASFTRA